MNIRRAVVADLPRLAELWKEFIDFNADFDPAFNRSPAGHVHWAAMAEGRLEDPAWVIFVAVEEGDAVGYCMAGLGENPPMMALRSCGFIQELAVSSDCRRRGIGSGLHEAAAAWLKDMGAARVELHVASANPISTAFWRKLGYKEYVVRMAKED
jgi:ribosomal protein S18 acetylase RimI-like enzyme